MSLRTKMACLELLAIMITTLLVATQTQSQVVSAPAKIFKLGYVKDESLLDNCGCSLYRNNSDERKQRRIFVTDMVQKASINLDGKDLLLRLIDHSIEKKGKSKTGDHSWEIYKAVNLKLRVDSIISKLCDAKDESCEVIRYKATITLTRNGRKEILRTIGICGC